MTTVLDVGCGAAFKGDVNIDLFPEATGHRCGGVIDVHAIPNFVLADARFLPFRDDAFDVVICSQLIEHLENPFSLLKELFRVSKQTIIVETVHRLGEGLTLLPTARRWFKKYHVSKFNGRWFKAACAALDGYFVMDYVISWRFWQIPYEFGVIMRK